ncbi:MAG: tetratricopeptide repeat-containing sensor histidine kinase [Bacteroidales bacterium]|jgi:signal transduction histidine kinase|nr:tetratricopeptide repeat-containing sensor histidine kinase [Bacteroidales bacterium]
MLKNIVILIFLISLPLLTLGTNPAPVDSLLKELEKSSGEKRMDILRQLSLEYLNSSMEEAIKYASELLKIAEEEENLKFMDLSTSFLGEAYFYMDDIDKSIEYFEKFLAINQKQHDIDGIGTAYNNLGIVYRFIEEYDKAIKYYLESLKIKQRLQDSAGISNTLNNIGVLYFHMRKYNHALDYYQQSLEIEKHLNNKNGIATSLLNIGELYCKQNNPGKAKDYLNRSIKIAETIGDMHTLEINYRCFYDLYKNTGNFEHALHYFEQYNNLKNSRLSQEAKKEIAELEIQYETRKKQEEIELLNKQNRSKRFIIISLSVVFILFLLMIYLLNRQVRAKNKALSLLSSQNQQIKEQSEKLDQLNNTKDKFFSIISHDLKGAIGGFLSQTQFLAEDFDHLDKKDSYDLIKMMKYSSEQLYSLLENLLEWSRTQTGSIRFQPEKFNLSKLTENIVSLFKTPMQEKEIQAKIAIDPSIEVFADINMIATVMRNLIMNSIKFSHPQSSFSVTAKRVNDYAEIEITDEGIGISDKDQQKLFRIDQSFSNPGTNREKGSGLGLILCKEFIEKNEGTIFVESEPGKGSIIRFTLKLTPFDLV